MATFLIEIGLAIYTLWRYKLTSATRLIVALLLALATFQLAEYFVCTGTQTVAWSVLGFAAISTLPPLGLHLMYVLAKKSDRKLVGLAYLTTIGFIGFFVMNNSAFVGHQCTGNYVIFQFSDDVTGSYSVYYFGWILAGISLGLRWSGELKTKGQVARQQLQTVHALIVGYLVFLVPSAAVMLLNRETLRGIPSILCGFAVLLAFILAGYILPRVGKPKAQA